METYKNKLTDYEKRFFDELSNYIEKPILFYGSIQRNDYFRGKSDIDVDVFTDNQQTTITKIQHFLHAKRSKFKKIIWRLDNTNKIIHGHKIVYENPGEMFRTEISIYDEKYKDEILKEHTKKMIIPFYISWMLIVIKILYYNLDILSRKNYSYLKNKLLSDCIGYPESDFIVIDTT